MQVVVDFRLHHPHLDGHQTTSTVKETTSSYLKFMFLNMGTHDNVILADDLQFLSYSLFFLTATKRGRQEGQAARQI